MSLISYQNYGAIRSLPLSPELEAALNAAGMAIGADRIIVHSGGQPTAAEGGARTGSTRHDHGGAGDIEIIVGGRSLNFSDPRDQPLATQFVQAASQQGLTGFGQGDDYMGPTRIHVGYGTPAVWGANGASANAPQWLLSATSGAAPTSTPAPSPTYQPAPQPTAAPSSPPMPTASGGLDVNGITSAMTTLAQSLQPPERGRLPQQFNYVPKPVQIATPTLPERSSSPSWLTPFVPGMSNSGYFTPPR